MVKTLIIMEIRLNIKKLRKASALTFLQPSMTHSAAAATIIKLTDSHFLQLDAWRYENVPISIVLHIQACHFCSYILSFWSVLGAWPDCFSPRLHLSEDRNNTRQSTNNGWGGREDFMRNECRNVARIYFPNINLLIFINKKDFNGYAFRSIKTNQSSTNINKKLSEACGIGLIQAPRINGGR